MAGAFWGWMFFGIGCVDAAQKERERPSGAKARAVLLCCAARLKPCPFKARLIQPILSAKQEQAVRIELNVPRLRLDAQRMPKLFGNVGLQMGRFAGLRGGVETQIERHFMGRFAGGRKPTWKGVFPD